MKSNTFLATVLASSVLAAAAAGGVYAAGKDDEAREIGAVMSAPVSLPQAIDIAEAESRGRTLEAGAEDKHGRVSYKVTTVAAQEIPVVPSGWVSGCTGETRQSEGLNCTVKHTIVLAETRQQLLAVDLRIPLDLADPAMMVHLPLGLFLPRGVTLQVGEQEPQRLDLQTCDQAGCYAGTAVSRAMLTDMLVSENLTVSFQKLNKEEITVKVSLSGFLAAYKKVQ